jgi:hypothetical protein
MSRALLLTAALLVGTSGCTFGAEAAFAAGAEFNTCDQAIPVCNTTAGCKMVEENTYIEGAFPGFRQMIVPTAGEAIIRVKILWRTQLSPGVDTEVIWFEPACIDAFSFESQGTDIFQDTGRDGILVLEKRVFREGDHLLEVRSDATGEYLLRTEVLTPDEFDLEQARGR